MAIAHGHDIDYQGIKIASFEANIDFDPAATERESHVELGVHKLSYKTRTLDAAAFTLQGLPSAYSVHLSASAPGLAANIQARGAYTAQSFRGQLTALTLSGNDALHLALERPVELLVSPDHVRVEWLCLAGTPGSICADGDWTPGGVVDDGDDERAAPGHPHRRHDPLGPVPGNRQRALAALRGRSAADGGDTARAIGGCRDRPPAGEQEDRAHPHRLGHRRHQRDAGHG